MCIPVNHQVQDSCESTIDIVKKLSKEFLKCLLIKVHVVFDFVVDILFGLYYDREPKKVPSVNNDLLLMSATKLAEKIRKKEVKSEDVVRTYIERSKQVQPLINAVVENRYAAALEEAKAVDNMLEKCSNIEALGKTKPFLGVPFTTKESNEAQDMLHTMGLLCRRDHRSKEDATVVRFLKEAGGILIAKTNVPELNLWCESRNNLYGQTCNPYNTGRTVGGSSGGESAIIAACGSAISIASDIGGSTRMPAFFTGVFGHKPSEGMTPIKGIGLRKKDYPNTMAEAGPLCKRADDLIPLLKVLVGEKISMLSLDEPVHLEKLNIFYQQSSGDLRASKVNSTMKNTLLKAVQHFKELTGSATKIRIPGSEYSYRLWRYWMSEEDADFKADITSGRYRASATGELCKLATGSCDLTFAALMKLIDEDLLPKENPMWARSVTTLMKQYLVEKLGDNGVLFFPSSPFPASYHYSYFFRPFNFSYWCLFNVLRFPCCQVPLGLDEQGLPVGVQVVAAPYKDHLCLAVAKELERAFGGWVPPS